MKTVSKRVLRGIAAGVITLSLFSGQTVALAQGLSDRSVKVLMDYAWAVLPNKFTTQKGEVIEVDKEKRDDVMVPVEVARGVIEVARLSAHAQICKLNAEQAANYNTMMRKEAEKKSWSPQQLLYISQLHLFTVMWLTGNVKLVERDGEKEVSMDEGNAAKEQTCTDAERKKVTAAIIEYVCKEKQIKVEGCPQ